MSLMWNGIDTESFTTTKRRTRLFVDFGALTGSHLHVTVACSRDLLLTFSPSRHSFSSPLLSTPLTASSYRTSRGCGRREERSSMPASLKTSMFTILTSLAEILIHQTLMGDSDVCRRSVLQTTFPTGIHYPLRSLVFFALRRSASSK